MNKFLVGIAFCFGIALVGASWYVFWPFGQKVAGPLLPKLAIPFFDADRATVRAFLRENLDDSNFEEVKWYPVKMGTATDYSSGDRQVVPVRLVKLKFRSQGVFGAKVLKVHEWQIRSDNGKIIGHGDMTDFAND